MFDFLGAVGKTTYLRSERGKYRPAKSRKISTTSASDFWPVAGSTPPEVRAPKSLSQCECPRRESNSHGVAPGGF